ncbi:MAG: tetratricopeptide repeat protein [bacterium]|nr:tetratricopeptide repeat protein [bacterium]
MRRQITIVLAFVIAAVFLAAPALHGQEGSGTGRLIGNVIDKDKKPLEGVKVTIEYMKFNRKLEKITDDRGRFAFLGLGKGMVRMKAEKEGFVDEGLQFNVSGVKRNPKKIIMMKRVEEIDPNAKSRDTSKNSFSEGLALFKARKFQEALTRFEKFREMQPKLYKIGINIANCYLELQRYKEAITELGKVLDTIKAENPDLQGNKEAAKIYSTIGDVYLRQNKFNEAEANFKKAIEIDPADHAVAYNVAEILFVAGKSDEAITHYELAIKIKPGWPKAYKQIGYAYLNKGDIKSAITNLKKFLELDPKSPEADGIKEVIKSLQ